MSHALKTAAVVPTDLKLLKKKLVFHSCHRDSDINAVIYGLNIITCAPKIAYCMSHTRGDVIA